MKIVVMGGSFNPPTIAHLKALQTAMNAVGADNGILIPSSHAYVKRKMSKAGYPEETLPEELRLAMLNAMAEDDARISVNDLEYHRTEKAFTYETLEDLQKLYPNDTLYFLAGGDKVSIFPRWHRIQEFLERFHIILIKRDDEDAATKIEKHRFLRKYKEMFHIIEAPSGIDGISSSAVRECLREGKNGAETMLHPRVLNIMQQYLKERADEQKSDSINFFRGKYHFLSNFYEAPVEYNGLCYRNNEAAFQAQKCLSDEEKQAFSELEGGQAKRLGRRVSLRSDWEEVKVTIMEEIVRAKFTQNPDLKEMLLATDNKKLIEGNTWNDTFWGVSLKTGNGKNHLGNILMKVREELRV